MKQIELNLKKRLLIVEGDVFEIPKYTQMWLNDKINFICKGSELTEEIAEGLVKSPDNFQFLDAENTFIGEIEKHGFYWVINPIEEPIMHQLLGADKNPNSEEKKWQEAESRTFNPEKTLIFEIL